MSAMIEWTGGECPVDGEVYVDIQWAHYVDGYLKKSRARNVNWSHRDLRSYRVSEDQELDRQTDRIAKLERLSVTNILLKIVPGEDGTGEEIYARSVDDVSNLLSAMSEKIESLEAALAKAQEDAGGKEVPLNIIRKWPEGFQGRLEHVWRDLIGFIPDYKLYDLQRTLAEFGFTMKVYEGAPREAAQPAEGGA